MLVEVSIGRTLERPRLSVMRFALIAAVPIQGRVEFCLTEAYLGIPALSSLSVASSSLNGPFSVQT